LHITAGIVRWEPIPSKGVNVGSVACGYIRHSYGMAPKAAQVKLSEFLFVVAKLVKL
jgi:hypothetical protein